MATPAEPPGPDVNMGPKLLGVTGAIWGLALVLYGTRMYTRIIPVQRLGWDDWMISIGFWAAVVEWGMLSASVHYGLGRHNYYLSSHNAMNASKWLWISQPIWVWSMATIKISIACMLLRIRRGQAWAWFLYIMIALQIINAIVSNCFQFMLCRPLSALWDPSKLPTAKCLPAETGQASIYSNAAIGISTDIIFSLLPITFIRGMQRPPREKIILGILMGLGTFCSAASIVKTTLVHSYGVRGDTLMDSVNLTMWSSVEQSIGVIAACIPCLKAVFEKVLGKLGLLSSRPSNATYGPGGYINYGDGKSVHLSTLRTPTNRASKVGKSADAQSEESILPSGGDSDYKGRSGRIVKTTEVHFSSEEIHDDWKVDTEQGESKAWKDV